MKKNELIEKLNLNSFQYDIYETLLKIGASTVLNLSLEMSVPRTTVHQNVEKMINKGILIEIFDKNKRLIKANNPRVFKNILENKQQILKSKLNKLKNLNDQVNLLVKNLENIEASEDTSVDVEFHHGKVSVSAHYDEILLHKEIRTYINPAKVNSIFPENVGKFEVALTRGSEIWDIAIMTDNYYSFMETARVYKKYHQKFFPSNINFEPMDYLIYGDQISIINSDDRISAIVIKNKGLANNSRVLYDLLWNFLPNPNLS